MLPKKIKVPPTTSKVVSLTGGLNEAVSDLELKSGELIQCLNYVELDGDYHGYASMEGYEAFDGTPLASSVHVDPETLDDTDREARRAAILPIPGTGIVRGVHLYKVDVYGVRDVDLTSASLYKSSAVGWEIIADPVGMARAAGGKCSWVNEAFAAYPEPQTPGEDYPPITTNTECLFVVDGVSLPMSYDGFTARVIDPPELPCHAGSADLRFPTLVTAFDGRLWLAFPGGHLFYSAIGDPSDFDAVNGAGYFPMGDDITSLLSSVGNTLQVHMENSIKVIYINEAVGDYNYQVKEFSNRSGAYRDTVVRLLGRTYYIDDRGLTSMAATEAFGDYTAKSLTKKVQRIFTNNKDNITVALPFRDKDQYRLFTNDGSGICFTFNGSNRSVKGATPFTYKHPVLCATEGDNASRGVDTFFGSDGGFIYKMDSGTSFNGVEIVTKLATSYYHYGSPADIKRFFKLLFEITSSSKVKFEVACDFDYGSKASPSNPNQPLLGLEDQGGVWGSSTWGVFFWGGKAVIQNPSLYIEGIGVNMSVVLRTKEKFTDKHVIHNIITNFNLLSKKM